MSMLPVPRAETTRSPWLVITTRSPMVTVALMRMGLASVPAVASMRPAASAPPVFMAR